MDFYNFFSFSAKKAIYRASEICGQFNNQYLEPEHAFYSILNLRSCSAVNVLHQLGVNLPKLTYSLEAYLYEHAGSYKGNAVFSQRMIQLLDASYREVKRLHHREIGTTHLLLGLAHDKSAFIKTVLEEHNFDAKKIRDAYLNKLKGYSRGQSAEEVQAGILGSIHHEGVNYGGSFAGISVAPVSYSRAAAHIVTAAALSAISFDGEFVRPAHLFYAALSEPRANALLLVAGIDIAGCVAALASQLRESREEEVERATLTWETCLILGHAYALALSERADRISVNALLYALLQAQDAEVEAALAARPEARNKLLELLLHPVADLPGTSGTGPAPASRPAEAPDLAPVEWEPESDEQDAAGSESRD
jgi:ATP-dependent Clp protease ATP-binding subunit ClpA